MLKLEAAAPHQFYAGFPEQNISDFNVGGSGRLDIGRTFNVSSGFSYGDLDESLGANPVVGVVGEPVHYQVAGGNLGASKVFNRIRLSLDGSAPFDEEIPRMRHFGLRSALGRALCSDSILESSRPHALSAILE